jgi:hypothetical protein
MHSRPSWPLTLTVIAVAVIAVAVVIGVPSQIASPGPTATASPISVPTSSPTSTPVASHSESGVIVEPGGLARVTAPAAILDEPDGSQWALLEPDRPVLVVGTARTADNDWYRVEFEFCCRSDVSEYEWVFGWVAADLETAGLAHPGFGIEAPDVLVGPTLEPMGWSCPATPEGLHRIPEPVRHTCYGGETIALRGALSGGAHGEGLYPGEPHYLTSLAVAALVPTGIESGERFFPLHLPPGDELLLTWLRDERVRQSQQLKVSGAFGSGAVDCTKEARLDDFPPMTPDEQQLWCDQQFTVTEIHGHGADPIVGAAMSDPLWTPPPGVQPTEGDGWRLLASATSNQLAVTVMSETVDVANAREEYLRLWYSVASGAPTPVDFERELVVRFVPPVSGTCPWIAFRGIGVDAAERLLYGMHDYLSAELFMDDVPEYFGCTTDATPHAFLVAVDRSLAPAAEFRVRLFADRICVQCGTTWDELTVRLGE